MSDELILDSLQRRMKAMHSLYHQAVSTMDIEHVNSIGTLLADLSARTQQLRGYL